MLGVGVDPGDPAFDAGFSMTHLLAKANHMPERRADFVAAAQAYWSRYAGHVTGLFADLERRAVRHTLACLLARVDGRSPLEYLTAAGRAQQRACVLRLMAAPPVSMPVLIDAFAGGLTSAQ